MSEYLRCLLCLAPPTGTVRYLEAGLGGLVFLKHAGFAGTVGNGLGGGLGVVELFRFVFCISMLTGASALVSAKGFGGALRFAFREPKEPGVELWLTTEVAVEHSGSELSEECVTPSEVAVGFWGASPSSPRACWDADGVTEQRCSLSSAVWE